MKKVYLVSLPLIVSLFFSFSLFSQNNFFTDITDGSLSRSTGQRVIIPEKFRPMSLDRNGLNAFLTSLPAEKDLANKTMAPTMLMPMPGGGTARFRVWESSIMEPALAAMFPSIKTFSGQGIDDPTATIRFDWTEHGFHAIILSNSTGDIFIDPYQRTDLDHYSVYFKKDLKNIHSFSCQTEDEVARTVDSASGARGNAGTCAGTQLRTFRLALACTVEYSAAVSSPSAPTIPLVLSAIVTAINRVDGVYEKEVDVRLVLIANEQNLIYLTGTDPYTNGNGTTMLGENQVNVDAIIGATNYDIGHVFSTGGGGIASLAVPCTPNKARGVTGLPNPTGDGFYIDFVAHEMGHQFGATHTFNSTTGNCGGGNRSASTAVEPGSGITIMGYAGICLASNDLAPNSIPTFHAVSFDQINTFAGDPTKGGSCAVLTATGNNVPVVNAGSNFTIPVSTPFVLSGTATDADASDVLTYSWEEIDAGPAGNWNTPSGNAALFRSFLPTSTGIRYFPKLSDQVNNTTTIGELLPSYSRNMSFRLTARDNRAGGGGVCSADMQMTVDGASGPFVVTIPSATGISWPANSAQTITWNVANTNNAPVSCSNVSIELSTDGGNTFTNILLASTPNDGSEVVTLPSGTSTTARIRVKAVGNVFYDMSNNNFTISAPVPGFDFSSPATTAVPCASATPATVSLGATSFLGYTTPVALTAENVPAGTSVLFGTNPVIPGNSTLITLQNANTLPVGTYTITIKGVSGAITRNRVLTFNVPVGAGPVVTTAPQSKQVCSGSPATFTIVTSSVVSAYLWQQSSDGGNSFVDIAGATTASLEIPSVATTQNSYQYRVVLTGQCNITTSAAATLTVYTLPKVDLASNLTSLLPGQQSTLTATITPGSTPTITATWFRDNNSLGQIPGNVYTTNVTSGLGAYQVKLLDVNGCTNQSAVVTLTAQASSRLFIYPNPTAGQFVVSYFNSGGGATRRSVTIYDARGGRVFTSFFDITGPYQLLNIDLTRQAAGVYMVVVGDAAGKKIVEGKVLVR